jgi:hypothetical protein
MQHTPDDLVEVRHAANYFSGLRSCSSVREDEEHLSREVCGERLREVVSSSLTGTTNALEEEFKELAN